ncbi:MAG TPA: ThaI family type II restriction endonuclease [Candidatus Acidoferrum sp.]|nr:ThaI family type II restriction endonuclease [Candidatus Acidoferrum sp.]
MNNKLIELFNDKLIVNKIKKRLPRLFQLAELESSRAGKIGMEVGSVREKIISSLLIYKFGEENVETELPITEPEVDVKLFDMPISVKTITGKEPNGVKLIWTVDPEKAKQFLENWKPSCDMILVQVNWGGEGGVYYISSETQQQVFKKLGRGGYIKLPKPGTNPRGVEISKEAIKALIEDKNTKTIIVKWEKDSIDYNPYKRWVDLWRED